MRLARKLLLLSMMALVALGLMAASATAQGVTVLEEEAEGNHACATLEPAAETSPTPLAQDVSGGCHVVFNSEPGTNVPLIAHTAGGPVEQSNCEISLEARVDSDGEGYVTGFTFDPPHPPSAVACTRTPCDNSNAEQLVWPIHIRETDGVERIEATFCLRSAAAAPGTAGISCHVNVPWNSEGGHAYEADLDVACDNAPFTFIEIEGHLLSDTTLATEQIEIVH
jgi:hypothetical protein